MKKTSLILMLAVMLVMGCKKADAPDAPLDSSEQLSIASEIQKLKESAAKALSSNETSGQSNEQTVYMPAEQQAAQTAQNAGSGTVSQFYSAPCMVSKYRGLNTYCKAKNFWHNQSTLFSWYIPYSIVALIALVLIVVIIWHLWRNR